MKRSSTIFLQVVLVLIGLGACALLLWEPQTEGVNAHATNFQIYFQDPFLALVYIGSIPFFIALYQAFKALGFAGRNKAFSPETVRCLRAIRYCALAIIGFVTLEEIYIMLTHGNDDATGGFFMGVLIALGSIIVAVAAAMFERTLQRGVDIQTENDLTV
jgi:hypothetical protein